MRATGHYGELRYGYQVAATFADWTLELSGPPSFTAGLRARVTGTHSVWIEEGPFEVALKVGTSEWRWRGVRPRLEGAALTCALAGRPEIDTRAA